MKVPLQMVFLMLLLFVGISCKNKFTNNSGNDKQVEKPDSGTFIAQTLYVFPNTKEQFLFHLKSDYLPIWIKLNNDNVLVELSVFKLWVQDSAKKEQNLCNYLILAHLNQGVKPKEFVNTAMLSKTQKPSLNSLYELQRMEVLYCTPNACFSALTSEKKTRTTDIDYLLEFIAVKGSINYVNQYHILMQDYFGPLNGVLVNEGKLHSIFILETAEVLFQRDNRFSWNQLHISGDFPEYVDLNWDSLYTDMFRRTFSCELDSVWELLPPILETSFDCTGKRVRDLSVK